MHQVNIHAARYELFAEIAAVAGCQGTKKML
jgi:hypothetical protein